MNTTARQRFVDYVRRVPGARPIVSPFLPHPPVIKDTLKYLGMPVSDDMIDNRIRLAHELDYEPMFMTDLTGLIFPWKEDPELSNGERIVAKMETPMGTWIRNISRRLGVWGDDTGFPVKTEEDYEILIAVCENIQAREDVLRDYFLRFRERVAEEGVIVIGHPHVTWMGDQVAQRNLTFHAHDYRETFQRGMDAICKAAYFIFTIAMEQDIDFMSESTYGLEMNSPGAFDRCDIPYLQKLSNYTHERGGMFWYHNCGLTQRLILTGRFNTFNADVIETISPPPAGDNDLAESRRHLDLAICSKGNLDLRLLRDGTPQQIEATTRTMVRAVRGYHHIHSTADTPLEQTPPENYLAFVRTAREESLKG